jgi:glycosyltransferase involved in cell wall biosynthesis
MANVASANLVGITGIARRDVLDGALEEGAAREAMAAATQERRPLAGYLLEKKLIASSDLAAANSVEFGMPIFDVASMDPAQSAIKRGVRAASGDVLVLMDADGQHDPELIQRLLDKLEAGFDMVVGARDAAGQASVGRGAANAFYNRLASWMTGHAIADLTSGFRAVRAEKFREFLHLLPNGFSYPTTSTMAFFRSAYPVAYVPIPVARRIGTNSHIRPLRDGLRFLLIIFRIATLYSPLKLFAPAALMFLLLGLGYYGYTFATMGRFTNMSALMLSASVIVFLIGLVSEQITGLTYLAARNQQRQE